MQISVSPSLRRLALLACALTLALPAAARAASVPVDLHVEAGGRALVPGQTFLTSTNTVRTDTRRPACNGSGAAKTLAGPTATGVLFDAARAVGGLSPVGLSDQFSFGLLVCGIGSYTASDSAFFLYKVNHVAPDVGGDQLKLKAGDEVLWYYQDTAAGRNTGDELAIQAPARARQGSPFTVTVVAYSAGGARRPAAGARLLFPGGETTTDASGRARVTVDRTGYGALRAGRGGDIPSPIVKVCVADPVSACSRVRGKRIFGTSAADVIRGSAGRDVVAAGAGDDRIDVRGGGRDVVRCGRGRDRVRLDASDRAARDCEVVLRSRRSAR